MIVRSVARRVRPGFFAAAAALPLVVLATLVVWLFEAEQRPEIEDRLKSAARAAATAADLYLAGQAGARLVASADLRPEPFSALLRRPDVPDGRTLAALDPSHVILGRSTAAGDDVGTPATPSLTAEADRASDRFFFSLNDQGARVYTAVSTSPVTGRTAAGAPAQVAEAPLPHATALLLGGAAAALALTLAAAAVVIRSRERRHAAERRLIALEFEQQAAQRLRDIAANFPGIIYRRVLHPDGRISFPYVSPGIASLVGEERSGVGPVTMAEFAERYIVPEDHRHWAESVRASAATLAPFDEIGRLRKADGEIRWVRSVAQTRRAPDGSIVWDGVTLDITDLKQAEAALRHALEERATLLQEVHHRVKNNLQVILSLVRMEMHRSGSRGERERLQAITQRIEIFARIHEQLYGSEDFAQVDLIEELKQLCLSVAALHERPNVTIEVIDADPGHDRLACRIELAIPLALLVNELVTNSLKHAFPADRGGRIAVSVRRGAGGGLTVTVEDNGVGFAGARTADAACEPDAAWEATGTGQRLMAGLASQIRAELRFESDGGGARASITVPPASAEAPKAEPAAAEA